MKAWKNSDEWGNHIVVYPKNNKFSSNPMKKIYERFWFLLDL